MSNDSIYYWIKDVTNMFNSFTFKYHQPLAKAKTGERCDFIKVGGEGGGGEVGCIKLFENVLRS